MMIINKAATKIAVTGLMCLSLGACATVKTLGYGSVEKETPIKLGKKIQHEKKSNTLCPEFLSGVCNPIVEGGQAVVSGIAAKINSAKQQYAYIVKPDYQKKRLSIKQSSKVSMPKGTRVIIQESTSSYNEHQIRIKPLA